MSPRVLSAPIVGAAAIRFIADGHVSAVRDLRVPFRDILAAFEPDEDVRAFMLMKLETERPGDAHAVAIDGELALCVDAIVALGFIAFETRLAGSLEQLHAFVSTLASAFVQASGIGDSERERIASELRSTIAAHRVAANEKELSA